MAASKDLAFMEKGASVEIIIESVRLLYQNHNAY
jgi:hypothetical protein